MSEIYTVINNSDGDTIVKVYTRLELLEALDNEHWGPNVAFLDTADMSMDTGYWSNNSIAIIGGGPIVPKAKERIIEYSL